MKSLPPEYALLMRINKLIEKYFSQRPTDKVARSNDIYEYIIRQEDMKKEFSKPYDFNHFLRMMHKQGKLQQIIKNVNVDISSNNFYLWYFYPPERVLSRKTTDEDVNLATSHQDKSNFFKANKIHEAANGTKVRSIQELNIMNRLLAVKEFDVYYERELTAAKQTRYPGFTIVNKNSNTVFHWEHFGGTGNENYDERMEEKLAWYKCIGYKSIDEGGRLIVSICRNNAEFIKFVEDTIQKIISSSFPIGFLNND